MVAPPLISLDPRLARSLQMPFLLLPNNDDGYPLIEILLQAVANVHSNESFRMSDIPLVFHRLYHEQERIGWEQLFYGRFSSLWSEFYERYNNGTNKPSLPGNLWIAQVIVSFWHLFLDLWKIRNEEAHPSSPRNRNTLPVYQLRIRAKFLLARFNNLPEYARQRFDLLSTDFLHFTVTELETWISTMTDFILDFQSTRRKQRRTKTIDLREFFPPLRRHQ